MANIFLTNKCNLKCPYCFAKDIMNVQDDMSLENFQQAIQFIKTGDKNRLTLVGGEPTIYPYIDNVLNILLKDNDFNKIDIFSNGIELKKIKKYLKNKKFGVLVNCNSPNVLGKINYSKLIESIQMLNEICPERFSLGINLYDKKINYDYIFDLLKIANKSTIRMSIAVSNKNKNEQDNILEYFSDIKPYIFKFYKDCLNHNVAPYNDCSFIPNCLLNDEDKILQAKIFLLSKKLKAIDNVINTCSSCIPLIDILPNLNATRCLGMSEYLKVPISKFSNINLLKNYMDLQIDSFGKIAYISEKCTNCDVGLCGKCGICYAYKIKKINTLKNYSYTLAKI
jgi:sulfatase maturation enzyme AslB (radical SAM superfamily)